MVNKYEFWEFLGPVIHDERCVGIVAQDMRTMQIRSFRADAVVMATGGCGLIFGKSTIRSSAPAAPLPAATRPARNTPIPNSSRSIPPPSPARTNAASSANPPAAKADASGSRKRPGDTRPPNSIPESERFYFLEERYPKYGNLVPRDIATREIFQVCTEMKLGVGGGNMVYLDLADLVKKVGRQGVLAKLEGILEIYEKFVGADPLDEPMKIFPAVHYSMGGLWAGFKKDEKTGGLKSGDPANMMTSIPGLYTMGEFSFAYHGANRLGANSLLSCIFDGLFGGRCVKNYCTDIAAPADDVPQSVYDAALKRETDRQNQLVSNQGDENPYLLWQEMGRWMTDNCTVVRHNERLQQTIHRCQEWKERYQRIKLSDTGMWTNQNLSFARAVRDMIVLAEAILQALLSRNESRGAAFQARLSPPQ